MDTGPYTGVPVLPEAHGDPAPSESMGEAPTPYPNQPVAPYPTYPTYPAYPVYPPAGTAEPGVWTAEPIGAPPGLPPTYGAGIGYGSPSRRQRPWLYGLVVLALLATLAGGVGIGRALGGGGATVGHNTTTIGAESAPTINVSTNVSSLQQTVEHVATAVESSVVEITSVSGSQEAIGSGDILTADGYIVTNDHVVQGFSSYTVTLANGTRLQAQVVGEDPQDDLAVVKVNASNLQPIAFADSSKVSVGEFAIAIGNPLGLRETATFGIVSAVNRTESESPDGPASVLTGLIQTSAPIAPGNSGGALVNLQGQLIGIPTLGQSSQQGGSGGTTIGFAISSNQVKSVAQQLIQSGHVASSGQGFLGIQGQDVTPALAAADGLSVQSGVMVAGFANDTVGQSPARQANLQTGDVIVAVDGQSIASSTDLTGILFNHTPGTKVTLTVVRGSSQLTLTVTLGERPANG